MEFKVKLCPLCSLTRKCNPDCALWLGQKRGCALAAQKRLSMCPDETLTRRKLLEGYDSYDFAVAVLRKAAELEGKYCNCDDKGDAYFDIIKHIERDFVEWLEQEVELDE